MKKIIISLLMLIISLYGCQKNEEIFDKSSQLKYVDETYILNNKYIEDVRRKQGYQRYYYGYDSTAHHQFEIEQDVYHNTNIGSKVTVKEYVPFSPSERREMTNSLFLYLFFGFLFCGSLMFCLNSIIDIYESPKY